MTEREKGKAVTKSNQEMKFPFQLTNATLPKRCYIERSQNPPTDSNEENYQAYFINACSKLPLLTRKPDCVTIDLKIVGWIPLILMLRW